MRAAGRLIKLTCGAEWNFDLANESHLLFAIQPKGKDLSGRMTPIAAAATDRIWEIISYATAQAQVEDRIKFYKLISWQPEFRGAAGQMFERFVLSWLASGPNVDPLGCSPADPELSALNIPACGGEQTYFFGTTTALKKLAKLDEFPICLLPISKTLIAVNAIVITKELIITIQVTISDHHSAKKEGFNDVMKSAVRRGRGLRHAFITDSHHSAESLRGQTLSGLPEEISLYSGVFDVRSLTFDHVEHMRALDEKKVGPGCMGLWLVLIGE
jgi:hypothetical protein